MSATLTSEAFMATQTVTYSQKLPQLTLQPAASSGSGDVLAFQAPFSVELKFFVEWSAGLSAGVVTIEQARSASYAGTWSPIAVLNFQGSLAVDTVYVSGIFAALRARISSNLIGGTVTVVVHAATRVWR